MVRFNKYFSRVFFLLSRPRKFRWAGFFLILLFTASCDTTEPPDPPPPPPDDKVSNSIMISVEWTDLYRIKVKWNKSATDTLEPYLYKLIQRDEQGEQVTRDFIITNTDTSHIAGEPDSLSSGSVYTFKVEGYNSDNKLTDTSKTIAAQTLTTTSHEITWIVNTLGQPGNFIRDVWGFDDNNVYAVGGINHNDGGTTLIKWDGINWNYHSFPNGSAYSIFGFNQTELIVVGEWANRGFVGHYNNSNWIEYKSDYFLSKGDTVYSLNSVWGSSPDNVWAVGQRGTIIHWNGQEWKKVDSGVEYYLNDIWGTSPDNIYAISLSLSNNARLLHYDGTSWNEITSQIASLLRSLGSIWFDKNGTGYLSGSNILHYNGNNFNHQIQVPGFQFRVRGRSPADVFTSGFGGIVYHYNGVDWVDYPELRTTEIGTELRGIYVGEKRVFIAGAINGGITIIRGERE